MAGARAGGAGKVLRYRRAGDRQSTRRRVRTRRRRADYDYVAVWKIPDIERVHAFAETWVRVGFHDYFEQEDGRGELMAPDAFIGHHIGL